MNVRDAIARAIFLPAQARPFAAADQPLPIGRGQTTSQPSTIARMVQALELSEGDRVLEIGAGTGYAAAALARTAGEVYAIERDPKLAAQAEANFARLGLDNVFLIVGDGSKGLPQTAPFDAILVSAAVPSTAALAPLVNQLAAGGILVAPVGAAGIQHLARIKRTPQGTISQDLGPVRFVPMQTGARPWQR